MRVKRSFSILFLCATLVVNASAVGNLPELGDASQSDLSSMAERKMGASIMRDIRWQEPSYLDDPEVELYLNKLGSRLALASDAPDQPFFFFGINEKSVNAFALPGGYIGVNAGLIVAAQSESELAGVIGHEIGHVTQRHIARSVSNQKMVGWAMLASMLAGLAAARSNPQLAQAAIMGGQAAALQTQLAYSRDFEREADRTGVQTLEKAGFDARGMVSFFERLQKMTRVYDMGQGSYLSTHPLTQERISDIGNRVAEAKYKQVVDSEDFLLVQAKLQAMEGSALEAIHLFETKLEKSSATDWPVRYGLASAYLRDNRAQDAQKTLQAFDKAPAKWVQHPMVANLKAAVFGQLKQPEAQIRTLEEAHKRLPGELSVSYALSDAYVSAGFASKAVTLLRSETQKLPSDARLWERLAKANAQNKDIAGQHRAQAELYVLQQRLYEAVNQLELAQKAPDADFYESSAIEARLREVRRRYELELKEKLKDNNPLRP